MRVRGCKSYFRIMNKEQSELETQLLILGIPSVRGKEDKDKENKK